MSNPRARDAVLSRFRWVDGHADVWRLFSDASTFAVVVDALAEVAESQAASRIAGIEARGFILGGAVAARAGLGFLAIRKEPGLFPGDKATRMTEPDYRGVSHLLRLQRDAISSDDRVLLVDDWAEVGSQAIAARQLVEECGGQWAGLALVVDQLPDDARRRLAPVSSIVMRFELGPDT